MFNPKYKIKGSDLFLVWHHGEVVKDVIDAEQLDVVIHFMAELFVTFYGEMMASISDLYPKKL
jgi:hypothetical protein